MKRFFAIVGPAGAGKTTLFERLAQLYTRHNCVFLSDSSGSNQETLHSPFVAQVSQIAKTGTHQRATSHSQLLLFWARLSCIIEREVLPCLENGKTVIMNGFGGTVLAHARCSTTDNAVRDRLLELHKDMIRHCVLGFNVPPPVYLWLCSGPEVSKTRIRDRQDVNPDEIRRINDEFAFYGQLRGQTVIRINADRPLDEVVCDATSIIQQENPELSLNAA